MQSIVPRMSNVGKSIGPYKILQEIGSGGMAVIYKAEQPALGRIVAIKELRTELAVDPSIPTRFEREAKSVAALTHQNIVHIYDFIVIAKSMFIVMEYVDGIDLHDLMLRTERVPPDIAAIVALQAARALEYAHYRGVVHRDFKPSNLMISKQGEVKLMDFGIARDEAYEDLTRPGTALGTPAYMSPEQIMGSRIDHRSDIFSFGIVLYQMVTGQKPFYDDGTKGVMQRIISDPHAKPRILYPDIPWSLQRIVNRSLQKDPMDRYETTEDLRRSLENFVARRVRINYSGRLVIYLRNRDLISHNEAATFIKGQEEQINTGVYHTDEGNIDATAVVFRPLSVMHAGIGFALAIWIALVNFTNLGVELGAVLVNVRPWGEVYVDGKFHDTTPFAKPIHLAPGQHTFELRNKFFQSESHVLKVAPGKTVRLDTQLKPRRK